MGVTIIDVLRDLKIEPDKKLTWALGQSVGQEWRRRTGIRPPVELQPKTNPGAHAAPHMICTYPDSFRKVIEDMIGRFQTRRQAQGDLFDA